MKPVRTYIDHLGTVAAMDCAGLLEAHKHYGDSCLKRGGAGLFMMLARKWDRLENQIGNHNYDMFAAYDADQRKEGLLDDIRDLRRYLMIAEAHLMATREGDFSELTKGVDVTKDKVTAEVLGKWSYQPPVDTSLEVEISRSGGEGEEAGPGYVNQDPQVAAPKSKVEAPKKPRTETRYRNRLGKVKEKVRHRGREITVEHWREISPSKDKIGKEDGKITQVKTLDDKSHYRFFKMEIRKDDSARLYWTSKRHAEGFILDVQESPGEAPDMDVLIQRNLFSKG